MLDEMKPVHFDFFAKCKSLFHSINFLDFVIMWQGRRLGQARGTIKKIWNQKFETNDILTAGLLFIVKISHKSLTLQFLLKAVKINYSIKLLC